MTGLMEAMLLDKKKMTPEQLTEYEAKKRKEEEVKKQKEVEREEAKHKIDLLKAKILIATSAN